ncbi:MAG: hypothetical protein ACR2IJ_07290 [Fluviibacter sp.]
MSGRLTQVQRRLGSDWFGEIDAAVSAQLEPTMTVRAGRKAGMAGRV